uniref:Uncharacterized protein n=1 Tax=Caenorhabditis japonica TaxID=281687 RepID=A0A8R1HGN3_CAEJA
MSTKSSSKKGGGGKPKYTLSKIDQIPGLLAYMVIKGNFIVQNTFSDAENPRQIAYNGMRMATRTQGAELRDLKVHTIQVQYDEFQIEMFQIGANFCIVKKRLDAE